MGGIDVLDNNAGIFEAHPVPEVNYEGWQDAWSRTQATNLVGPANLCFLAARIMMESGGGRVVNVSSRGASRGESETPAYGASKAGLNAMSQSMAQALAPHGVFFYVVAPGFVETEMADALLRGPEGTGSVRRVLWGASPPPRRSRRPWCFWPRGRRTS
jgi:NAD(P)-dependent dehydrogenase (short-subunit alcohol dehydrogenase family)